MKRLLDFYIGVHTRRLHCDFDYPEHGGHTRINHIGLLVNWRALWVGAHYSKHDKRLCLNLLPCVTLWWTKPGGRLP
ncbi:MAG: hypothetical protein [Bacteriophage sp.]|nr:MAG: hypothetical protein [Bacteriophage sp.]